jgi:hypothetical protein
MIVDRYIGGIFESAFADPEIGPKLVATGGVLGFEFSDPDLVLVVDTPAPHRRCTWAPRTWLDRPRSCG